MIAMRAVPVARTAAATLLTTPTSFLVDVGHALGAMLLISAFLFIYIMVLLAPFFILYQILRILTKLAGRIAGGPRPAPVRRDP